LDVSIGTIIHPSTARRQVDIHTRKTAHGQVIGNGSSRKGACYAISLEKLLRAGVALSIILLSIAAMAGPKEDVAAATLTWARAFGEDGVAALCRRWGTLSPTVRTDRTAFAELFRDGLFKGSSRPQSIVSATN